MPVPTPPSALPWVHVLVSSVLDDQLLDHVVLFQEAPPELVQSVLPTPVLGFGPADPIPVLQEFTDNVKFLYCSFTLVDVESIAQFAVPI